MIKMNKELEDWFLFGSVIILLLCLTIFKVRQSETKLRQFESLAALKSKPMSYRSMDILLEELDKNTSDPTAQTTAYLIRESHRLTKEKCK